MNLLYAISILLWAPPCLSWTYSAGVDIAWPPLTKEGYLTIDSKKVDDRATPDFPCAYEPLTGDEPRVIFPVTGGQLQWNLTNSTGGFAGYQFMISIYIGQISTGKSEYHNESAYLTEDVWDDFPTRLECGGETINATTLINNALNTDYNDADIVGMNATFGMRSVLFGPPGYHYPSTTVFNIEEMYQCGYVIFASDDTPKVDFGNACAVSSSSSSITPTSTAQNTMAVSTSTRSSTATAHSQITIARTSVSSATSQFITSSPSSTSSSSATSSPTLVIGATNSQKTNANIIGIGVGVFVAVSSALALLGFLLFRRRRKQGGTLALDFWVHGRQREHEEVDMENKKAQHKDIKSSSDSVHSEPPPAYPSPGNEGNGDVILKSTPKVQEENGHSKN